MMTTPQRHMTAEIRKSFELAEKKAASEVVLRSSFNDWQPISLKKRIWGWGLEHHVQIPYGHHFFYFLVDGVRCVNHLRDTMKMEDGLLYNLINIFPSPESESSETSSDEEDGEEGKRKVGEKRENVDVDGEEEVEEGKGKEEEEKEKEKEQEQEQEQEQEEKEKEKEKEQEKEKEKESNLFGRKWMSMQAITAGNNKTFGATKPWGSTIGVTGTHVYRQSSYHSISQRLPLNQFLLDGVFDGDQEVMPGDTTHHLVNDRKLLVVMVGLPARGKSYTSLKLCRYLNWVGCKAQEFNFKLYREKHMKGFQTHHFFKDDNYEAVRQRDDLMKMALQDGLKFLQHGGRVAILDGTNVTMRRRRNIREFSESFASDKFSLKLCFLELKCDDEAVLKRNMTAIVEAPNYSTELTKEQALDDLQQRINHYSDRYEEVGMCDYDKSYIKVIDVGRKIITNRISGFVLSRILCFIMNLHSIPRPIYLCRHGESEYNVNERLGGDPHLSDKGRLYSQRLSKFVHKQLDVEDLNVWTSTMKRTIETSLYIRDKCAQFVKWKVLDEIDVGICDGMTYAEIEHTYKDEFEERKKDKLRYRYPRGESYEDVVKRVEPVIMEIERSRRPLLIICHRAVLRCLYAYLTNTDKAEMPLLDIPLHTVFKISPNAYGTEVEKFPVDMS